MKMLDIGYANTVNAQRIVAVVSADSAPARRMISAAKEKNLSVDASCGKKTQSVIIMDSGHVISSSKSVESLNEKLSEVK